MRVICFDLDDTLYKEIDYLKSAYREIAEYAAGHCAGHMQLLANQAYYSMLDAYHDGLNAFEQLNKFLGIQLPISDYLNIYRNHKPKIALSEDVVRTLDALQEYGVRMGLITDGRFVQQHNKMEALNLFRWIAEEDIVISERFGSEKPSIENYAYFMKRYPQCQDFTYVGDNLNKDFVAPHALGWTTICLRDDGRNIHKQVASEMDDNHIPQRWILNISEIYKD